jgi:hypothetical protein
MGSPGRRLQSGSVSGSAEAPDGTRDTRPYGSGEGQAAPEEGATVQQSVARHSMRSKMFAVRLH